MKISILLPYKENYSKDYAGAVSIFINGLNNKSKFKRSIKVFGNTNYSNILSKNYINIPFQKKLFYSSSKLYLKNFIELEKKRKSDIIEIHNRPHYLKFFSNLKDRKYVFYFHNDPLKMIGSTNVRDRIGMLNFCHKIIFNSEWTKKRFFKDIDKFYINSEKIEIIYQTTKSKKTDLKKKNKIITFVGRLNTSKGYDIFGKTIIKILDKYQDWSAYVVGDEPREKLFFSHKRMYKLGYQSNDKVLKIFEKSSIAVSCSRWDEPFGRSSMEASSRGCAVIISNKGGLPESITDGIILKKLDERNLYHEIKNLITNKTKLKKIQNEVYKNFYLDHKFSSSKVDTYREKILKNFTSINLKKNKLKILHVTNFNIRHDGRLFYNTGRRINNGFLKLGHTVQTFSDRDIISNERKITDITGFKSLNQKLIEVIGNFKPNLIVFGHADQISNETISKIISFYPSIRLCQWFLDRMDNDEWIINKKRFMRKLNLMNANFCTTHPSVLNNINKKTHFIPNPVDEMFDNLKIYLNKNYQYDLFFAMSHGVHRGTLKKGKKDKRELFLNNLENLTSEIKCNFFGNKENQPVWGEEFKNELSKSKMALNLSQGKPIKFYSSDRIAQLIGNGILTFVEIKTELNKIFKNNKEVIFYKDEKELINKIIYFKNKNKIRNKIAMNGMKKYHKFMNSKQVSNYIIEKTFNVKNKKKYIWENS